MSEKVVYLMRGLPSCGKSYSAKQLAGDTGLVCETDAYFFTQIGDDALSYDYDATLLATARRWNRDRFKQAVKDGISPIVVDRGNSLSVESQRYARFAVEHGYEVELREPASAWWQEIRVLLKYKQYTKPILVEWSKHLAAMSRSTHRVSANSIRRRMAAWKHDLTAQDILDYEPKSGDTAASAKPATDRQKTSRRRGVISIDPSGSQFQPPPIAVGQTAPDTVPAEPPASEPADSDTGEAAQAWVFDEATGDLAAPDGPSPTAAAAPLAVDRVAADRVEADRSGGPAIRRGDGAEPPTAGRGGARGLLRSLFGSRDRT